MTLTNQQQFGLGAAGVLVAGLAVWGLTRRFGPKGPAPDLMSPETATEFADVWADRHRDVLIRDTGLVTSQPIFSRIVFFIGQPPRMSDSFWRGLEDPGQYYYVEYRYLQADPTGTLPDFEVWLGVMINPFTGEKPEGVTFTGWQVGKMDNNFGL